MSTTAAQRSSFPRRLDDAIHLSDLTDEQFAQQLGYTNANIITLFRKGMTRLPLDKVVPTARLLGLHPGELLREWFLAYFPVGLMDIEEQMGPILTAEEKSWITGLRRHLKLVPRFDDVWGPAIKTTVQETDP
jgi:hypothetical protein